MRRSACARWAAPAACGELTPAVEARVAQAVGLRGSLLFYCAVCCSAAGMAGWLLQTRMPVLDSRWCRLN